MHSYHDATGSFPLAATRSPRHTWVVHVWPYVEQGNLLAAYGNPATQQFYLPPATITNTTNGVISTPVPLYYCPSDRPGSLWKGDIYWRARGNYVVNWGARTTTGTSTGQAPFGFRNGNSALPQVTQMTQIIDGTSNTLLLSEVVVAPTDVDFITHGDIFNDDIKAAGTMFMTLDTPNSGVDVMYCRLSTDPMAPCVDGSPGRAAARSRHGNGVNAAFCDGSVRTVSNSIPLPPSHAPGPMNGRDPVPAG